MRPVVHNLSDLQGELEEWCKNPSHVYIDAVNSKFAPVAGDFEAHARKNLWADLDKLNSKALGCACSSNHGNILVQLWEEKNSVVKFQFEIVKLCSTLFLVKPVNDIIMSESKFAIFDLDDTIIPCNFVNTEWRFLPNRLEKLREFHNKDYQIIIISNKAGVTNAKGKLNLAKYNSMLNQIMQILENINLPIWVYLPTGRDKYRKPNTGIIEEYVLPNPNKLDRMFYVGDAAGRANDFADTDRKFAYNIFVWLKTNNLKLSRRQYPAFFTQTEFFENKKESLVWHGVNPIEIYRNSMKHKFREFVDDFCKLNADRQFLLVMVGAPASGKSQMAHAIHFQINATDIISQDKLKTNYQCVKRAGESLDSGFPVIIDNTNPMHITREKYLNLARARNISTSIIFFDLNRELIDHLNIVRTRVNAEFIPQVAYNVYYKNLQKPSADSADCVYTISEFWPHFTSYEAFVHFLQRS